MWCNTLDAANANDGCEVSACLSDRYLEGKAQLLYPEPRDVFPCELLDSEMCRPPTSYL